MKADLTENELGQERVSQGDNMAGFTFVQFDFV